MRSQTSLKDTISAFFFFFLKKKNIIVKHNVDKNLLL